jgi:hypothetical protein
MHNKKKPPTLEEHIANEVEKRHKRKERISDVLYGIAFSLVVASIVYFFTSYVFFDTSPTKQVSEPDLVESFSPTELSDCNRTYYETSYKVSWTSVEDAHLDIELFTGKITYTPPRKEKHRRNAAWGMSTDKFFNLVRQGI